jgi:hypothetical protein
MYEMEGPRSVSLHRRTRSRRAGGSGRAFVTCTGRGPAEVAFGWVPRSVTGEVLLPAVGVAQGVFGASGRFIFRVNRVSTRWTWLSTKRSARPPSVHNHVHNVWTPAA